MIQVVKTEGLTKSKTTCPKCGEEIDAGKSVFCPYCGAEVVAKQIDIIGAKKKKYPEKCPNPKCAKKLSGDFVTCPYCKRKLTPIVVDDKVDKKDLKLMKKTAASEKDLKSIGTDVENEYGTEADLKELAELDKKITPKKQVSPGPATTPKPLNWIDPNKTINVILSDNQQFAAFKGASILGTLPSFRQNLIDYQTFLQNGNLVVVDFSRLLNL